MKVLIVCRQIEFLKKCLGYEIAPFVKEQVDELINLGLEIDYFLIRNHGIIGYLKHFAELRRKVKTEKYNIIHAHGGHVGSICSLQRITPVVVTFHGSDINKNILYSLLAIIFSSYRIFVSNKLLNKLRIKKRFAVIPCGINLNQFYPKPKKECRKLLNIKDEEITILFPGHKKSKAKNFRLAKKVVDNIINAKLIEVVGYSRDDLVILLNASDILLMTSLSEGSPQIVKEAMACNLPIVATDVGDVKEILEGTQGCYITSYDEVDVINKLKLALENNNHTNGRNQIKHLSNDKIAKKIIKIYNKINYEINNHS